VPRKRHHGRGSQAEVNKAEKRRHLIEVNEAEKKRQLIEVKKLKKEDN
jgi:hypothetical protein